MADNFTIESYCIEKAVPSGLSEFLQSLNAENLSAVKEIIIKLNPSSNSLRSIIDLLKDISERDGVSFLSILNNAKFKLLIESEGPLKHKQTKLRENLERIRYPEKFKIENELTGIIDEIKNEFGLKISLPPELEGDQLSILLNFRNPEQLEKLSSSLSLLAKSDYLEQVFKKLLGED